MPRIRKVILVSEFISTYDRGLLRGIGKYSRLHGPWVFYKMPSMYLNTAWRHRSTELSRLKDWGADGIITRLVKSVQPLIDEGIPVIHTDDSVFTKKHSCVISDYKATGEMAAKHLFDRGFRNFAYCGVPDMHWSIERGKAFVNQIESVGGTSHLYEFPKGRMRSWENELPILAKWLRSLPKPIGLMSCSDNRSQEICEACKFADLHVPEEVAVIGVDNDEVFCSLSNPPLSSVAFNTEKAGYDAAELLDRTIAGECSEPTKVLVSPTRVVTRHSTDILAIDDSLVAESVRFIRENFRKSIQVSDIVSSLAVSRRTLERRFRKSLGRSVHDEIRRVHADQAAQMLVETNLSVSEIAIALGYPDIDNIARYFKKEKGLTPLAYRKKFGGK